MPNKQQDTREGRNRRVIGDDVAQARTGVIERVREHAQVDDEWNYHLDVRIDPETNPRKVPLAVPMPLLAAPPRPEGHPDGPDMALLVPFADDAQSQYIATNIVYNDVDRPPIASAGQIRVRRGSLYVEMDDQGDWARIAKKGADDGSPGAEIELDDSGSNTIATVDADTVVLGAGGTQVIKDVTVSATKDADGHVTDVSLTIDRSTVTETE